MQKQKQNNNKNPHKMDKKQKQPSERSLVSGVKALSISPKTEIWFLHSWELLYTFYEGRGGIDPKQRHSPPVLPFATTDPGNPQARPATWQLTCVEVLLS